jgi:Tfp pilus assembly protein PilV
MNSRRQSHFLQQGLTLPETLAAFVGLAIVVLGIVAVHVERLQTQPEVARRVDAKLLADEMATVVHDAEAKSKQDPAREAVRYENPIGMVCSKEASGLSIADAAANQVACWQSKIATRLPNGSGTIALDQTTVPVSYVVTVSWSQASGSTASYVVRTSSMPGS